MRAYYDSIFWLRVVIVDIFRPSSLLIDMGTRSSVIKCAWKSNVDRRLHENNEKYYIYQLDCFVFIFV